MQTTGRKNYDYFVTESSDEKLRLSHGKEKWFERMMIMIEEIETRLLDIICI